MISKQKMLASMLQQFQQRNFYLTWIPICALVGGVIIKLCHNRQFSTKDVHFDIECVICRRQGRQVVFCPCNHIYTCAQCSVDLISCPICRTKIEQKNMINNFFAFR